MIKNRNYSDGLTKTHLKVIGYGEASGRLKEIYEGILRWRQGRLPPPYQGLSLNPDAVEATVEINKAITFGNSSLGVRREEMLGTFVSHLNACHY